MLSLALSQWTDLSVVDYERSLDLLRDAKMGDNERIGLEDARAVARRAGAGTVIMGLVTSTTDSIHVVARIYNVASGRKIDETQRGARASEDPRGMFQSLADDLLNLTGGPKGSVELTKATTTSVDAYRTYLEGVRRGETLGGFSRPSCSVTGTRRTGSAVCWRYRTGCKAREGVAVARFPGALQPRYGRIAINCTREVTAAVGI